MITREQKTTYKVKGASFNGNNVLNDENGEIIDLMSELSKVFPDNEFDITVTSSDKVNLDIEDFENEEKE